MSARFFIRDDDACTLNNSFRFFFDAALERSIPIIYAVIPGRMDQKFIQFMIKAKHKNPALLDLVQHGWQHTNHALKGQSKYEFGASRSLKTQREDICQGQLTMSNAFADLVTPVFVPPYHGYDERTLQIVEKERFKGFSAGVRRAKIKRKFINLPVQISFTHYEDGNKIIKRSKDVRDELLKSFTRHSLSGIVTHHADFKTAASRKELIGFFDLVNVLKTKNKGQVLLFSDLLKKVTHD